MFPGFDWLVLTVSDEDGRHNSLVSLEYRSQLKLKVGHLYLVKVVDFFC